MATCCTACSGSTEGITMSIAGTIRKTMGWCPNANLNRKVTLYRHAEIPEVDLGLKSPLSRPILLKNVYVEETTRDAVIGISMALILIILAIVRFSPFLVSNLLYLIMLSTMLLLLLFSRTSVEIRDRNIRVLNPILGSTNRDIAWVDSVEVRKNSDSRLCYSLLFLLGILWLFRFFLNMIEGESNDILIQSLSWVFVCFGFGYYSYSTSKSMFNIRIQFTPWPSINAITIHSADARRIADLIEPSWRVNSRTWTKYL